MNGKLPTVSAAHCQELSAQELTALIELAARKAVRSQAWFIYWQALCSSAVIQDKILGSKEHQ